MIRTIALSAGIVLIFSGCTARLADPEISFAPPEYVEQMPPREEEQNFASTGSIFGQGDSPLFSDRKAMHVNDIVTILITENASSSNTASRALNKTDALALGGGALVNNGAANGTNAVVDNVVNKVNQFTNLGFNADSTSTFNGSGSTTKDASFTTTISARIIKVLQNGNYFIEGRREIMIDDEKQIMQLSGVIRPYDIDPNNQIESSQIADAKIYYGNQGSIESSTQRGWGSKLVNAVWPF